MRPVRRIAPQAFPKEISQVWHLPGIPSGHNLPVLPRTINIPHSSRSGEVAAEPAEWENNALIRLVLAGDARATFPVGEGFGEQQKTVSPFGETVFYHFLFFL